MPAHLPPLPSSIHKHHFPLLLHEQLVILYPCLPLPLKHPPMFYCVPANWHFIHLQVWDPREIIFLRMMISFSWKDSMLRLVTLKYLSMAATRRGGGMVHFISMLLWWNQWRLRGRAVSLHHFIHACMGCQKTTSYNSDTGGRFMPDYKNIHHDYLFIILSVF